MDDCEARAVTVGKFEAVAVAVIAYILLQEFSQLRSATSRSTAEACLARQKLIVDTMPVGPIFGRQTAKDKPNPYEQEWARRDAEFQKDCVGYVHGFACTHSPQPCAHDRRPRPMIPDQVQRRHGLTEIRLSWRSRQLY
jgi:hypothetical protein